MASFVTAAEFSNETDARIAAGMRQWNRSICNVEQYDHALRSRLYMGARKHTGELR